MNPIINDLNPNVLYVDSEAFKKKEKLMKNKQNKLEIKILSDENNLKNIHEFLKSFTEDKHKTIVFSTEMQEDFKFIDDILDKIDNLNIVNFIVFSSIFPANFTNKHKFIIKQKNVQKRTDNKLNKIINNSCSDDEIYNIIINDRAFDGSSNI